MSTVNFGGNRYQLDVDAAVQSYNQGGNYSDIYARIIVRRISGSGYMTNNAQPWNFYVNGTHIASGTWTYNFGNYSTADHWVWQGTWRHWHNADGTATPQNFTGWVQMDSGLGSASAGGTIVPARIAKAPSTPGAPTVSSPGTDRLTLSWSLPNDNGAGLDQMLLRRFPTSDINAAGYTDYANAGNATARTVTGLAAGTNYWWRVYAHNAVGYSPGSGGIATATLPNAPTALVATSVGTTSFTLGWTAPSGNGITGYEIQQADNSGFNSPLTWAQTGTSRAITDLAPAVTYYYRVRAQTIGGWGAWSSVFSIAPGLPAPTLNSAATNTSTWNLDAAWSAPSITTGLIGYRVQTALDAAFTDGVESSDVGNVLSVGPSRVGGRIYYVRVAARTAGGVNTWSGTRSAVLQRAAGNVDGWTRVGTKPAAITYYTQSGIRREGGSLVLESLATGAVTLAANTFGIQRTVTGLTVGKTYRFTATGSKLGGLTSQYRLEVVSEDEGDTVTLATGTSLGDLDFVADATSAVLRIMLAQPVTVTGPTNEVENVSFAGIRLLEMVSDYPQRLRPTVYESNLANHFDLACNSVGASWYAAKDGVTRFRLPGEALPLAAVFADDGTIGATGYVDVEAGYDTRSTVNRIEATNYGVGDDNNEQNDTVVVQDAASQSAYGIYSATLSTNLYTEPPYDESFNDRLDDLLTSHAEPDLLISRIRWNAQEDLGLAAALEVGDRIVVRYRGHEQNSQIVAIQHDMTPRRWMQTLDLNPLDDE